jgi:hypothetical protein
MNPSRRIGSNARLWSSPWGGLTVAGAGFFLAAFLTWRKWPDVLVDFGMQLYLPWKISTGSVLYQDVKYLTGGPLSQYFDALLFKLFGASLLTLVIANLSIAFGLVVLIYRRFLDAADVGTATMIGLGIVLVFTFGQYSNIGNFNYITPYCHEVWHGLALSILAVTLLSGWIVKESIWRAAVAGFCGGMVFMTKPEVFTALAVGVLAAFILCGVTKKHPAFMVKSFAAFLIASLMPLLGFTLLFHRSESWHDSLRSVAFAWVPLLNSSVSHNAFYQWCLGLDAPWFNLRALLLHFVAAGAIVAVTAFLFRADFKSSRNRLTALAWGAILLGAASRFNWVECGRTLPLLSVVSCVILCLKLKRSAQESPPVFPLLWNVFGLMLLAKLGLYSRIWHYGFALAMPAFVGAIYLLLWLLPQAVEKYGVHRRGFQATMGLVLLVGFARLFIGSQFNYRAKTVAVGRGADKIIAASPAINSTGGAMQAAIEWMNTNALPNATLAVLPEGIMVNYLTRRTNPTHYFVWNPAELAAFGQDQMTASFEANAPDYIMLIHRDAAEYGAKYFGQEEKFGLPLMQWIRKNYEPVWLIGSEPLRNNLFGIRILKRIKTANK